MNSQQLMENLRDLGSRARASENIRVLQEYDDLSKLFTSSSPNTGLLDEVYGHMIMGFTNLNAEFRAESSGKTQPGDWSQDQLANYLIKGYEPLHLGIHGLQALGLTELHMVPHESYTQLAKLDQEMLNQFSRYLDFPAAKAIFLAAGMSSPPTNCYLTLKDAPIPNYLP